jgi:trimethylamine--corrinoid protein Co-methyltransferase
MPVPNPVRPAYSRLSTQQCERIHEASLAILERTGARLLEPEAVELLRAAGASVEGADRVRIPRELVARALETAPRSIVLHDRSGEEAIHLGGAATYFGTGSDCLNIVDHQTGERRHPTLADLERAYALVDELSNIDFVMSMFLPSDVDGTIADRYQFALMLERTTKPIVLVTYDIDGMLDALEMAELVAGSRDALRERPFLATYINVNRALLQDQDALRKLLLLADRGLPALWIPVTSGGTTGPVTMAGNVALNTAGVLIGVVLSQLKRPGAPIVIPGFGGDALDLRTMVDPYAEPDHRGMAQAMAHFYGLPMFSLAAGGEAKVVDGQAAAEAALTMLHDALAGGGLIHDCGYLESGLTGSLAQLVICDEIVSWIRRSTAPVVIDDETLALDLIDEIGIEGDFLDTDHTLAHYRERWYPDLFERLSFSAWQSRGSRTLAERAGARVDEVLGRHVAPSLEDEVRAAVWAIVARAEAAVNDRR